MSTLTAIEYFRKNIFIKSLCIRVYEYDPRLSTTLGLFNAVTYVTLAHGVFQGLNNTCAKNSHDWQKIIIEKLTQKGEADYFLQN